MPDQPYLNLRLRPAEVLRLQPGDIVVLRVARPLASSETQKLVDAWKVLMRDRGLESVDMMVLGGVDTTLQVMHPEK